MTRIEIRNEIDKRIKQISKISDKGKRDIVNQTVADTYDIIQCEKRLQDGVKTNVKKSIEEEMEEHEIQIAAYYKVLRYLNMEEFISVTGDLRSYWRMYYGI